MIFPKSDNTFVLKDREEVVSFVTWLNKYEKAKLGLSPNHISLVNAYDKLQERKDGGRVFTALLDLQINYILLARDHTDMLAIMNTYFPTIFKILDDGSIKYKSEGSSVFDSEENFFGKMEVQRYSTTFVLKYRALFDKIMGFIILMFAPAEYETFFRARRKKNSFVKIVGKMPQVPQELVAQIEKLLTGFDDTFRTPEAHGTGVLRKWVFLMDSHWTNPQGELMDYWNFLVNLIVNIGKLFRNIESNEN
ncbi:MAG: hypothetical protein ABR577_10825 [Pyrinomonadaceae bacterium]